MHSLSETLPFGEHYEIEAHSPDLTKDFCGSFTLRQQAQEVKFIPPYTTIYVYKEKAVVFTTQDVEAREIADSQGIRVNGLSGKIWRGQTILARK